MSTVDVSEYGLPVDCVSITASSCVLERSSAAAVSKIFDRSTTGVDDQAGNAFFPACTAASRSDCVEVWIVAIGSSVDGSIASCDFEPCEGFGAPLMNACRLVDEGMLRYLHSRMHNVSFDNGVRSV